MGRSLTAFAACISVAVAAGAAPAPRFTFSMPWICLERCGEDAAGIAADLDQLSANASLFPGGASFELFNLGPGSTLVLNNLTRVVKPLQAAGLQTWAMVSSYPYPPEFLTWMRQVFANPSPFVQSAVSAASALGLTGLNVDWEPTEGKGAPVPTDQDAADYAAFLTVLADALHAKGMKLSVDVATWTPIWNLTLIGQSSVDYVMTMNTYTGSDALFAKALDEVAAAIPAAKLVVGLETVNDDSPGGNDPFNTTALSLRFGAIEAKGITQVAFWRSPLPDNFWPFLTAASASASA